MNTQGTGTSESGLSFTQPATNHEEVGPMPVVKRTVFSDTEKAELIVIFKEAMTEFIDERNGNNE